MKFRAIALLMLAEVAAMLRQAALSSGVQFGFVVGALGSAVLGLADRFDPRHVFCASAIAAALLVAPPGGIGPIAARILTGALLAGVYPVGMKIAVGWGVRDRGFLVGALVGAVTLGSASPHLLALIGGADWRVIVATASMIAEVGASLHSRARSGCITRSRSASIRAPPLRLGPIAACA